MQIKKKWKKNVSTDKDVKFRKMLHAGIRWPGNQIFNPGISTMPNSVMYWIWNGRKRMGYWYGRFKPHRCQAKSRPTKASLVMYDSGLLMNKTNLYAWNNCRNYSLHFFLVARNEIYRAQHIIKQVLEMRATKSNKQSIKMPHVRISCKFIWLRKWQSICGKHKSTRKFLYLIFKC